VKNLYPHRLALMAGAVALFMRCMDGVKCCRLVSAALIVAASAVSFVLYRRRSSHLWLALLLLLLGVAGLRLPQAGRAGLEEPRYSRGEVCIEGEVALDSPLLGGDRVWIIEVGSDPSGLCRQGQRIRLETAQPLPGLAWQDRVEARGTLVTFASRGSSIGGVMRCSSLRKLGRSSRPLVTATTRLRVCMTGFCLEEVGEGAEGHLLAGLVIGDLGILDSETSVAIRRAGLSHICAASGLNVSIMAGMVIFLGRKARLSRMAQFLPTLVLVLLYVLISGGKSPMIRATLAVPLIFLAVYLAVEFHALSAVSLSLIVMLLWEPAWLYSLSFQLSFISILGIILMAQPVQEALSPRGGKVAMLLAVTMAAQLATAPLTAGCFGEVSIVAPLANLLVVPTVPAAMALGLIGGMMRLLHLPFAFVPARLALLTVRFVLGVARTLSSPGWSTVVLHSVTFSKVVAYYLALWAVFVRRRGRRWRRPFLACLTAAVCVAAFTGGAVREGTGSMRAVFFDVGQGDAIMVESASGTRILVDGGEDRYVLREKLRNYGVRRIDLVILTHPDADHVGGLGAALDECEVSTVMEAGQAGGAVWRDFREKVEMEGANSITAAAGDVFDLNDLRVEVIAPPRAAQGSGEVEAGNNASLVCRLSGPGFSLLVTGDIEQAEEEWLLKAGGDLRADVLKVPHHGGYAAASGSFFAKTAPFVSVISVGIDNKYGHDLERAGSRTYRTDQGGDIIIEAGSSGLEIEEKKRK
jgi:competence protein ComEC